MDLPPKIQRELEEYFESHKIPPAQREKIKKKVHELYMKSVYDPEEAIGVVTAQSLSEPATQMTMRTYHFAGTAGIQVTLGLPRMIEIFDARKEPRTPTMTVYIKPEYQDIEKVKKIAEQIREVKVRDVVLSTVLDLTEMWISCKLDMKKIKELDIDLETLPKKIKLRSADVSVEGNELIVNSKKDDIGFIHKLKYAVLESHIKGIRGVTQVVVSKENGEWVITTLGSNLKKVFEIEGVDPTRTTTNNIFEIYDVLGIEAARNAIINQAKYTMDEQGLDVDIRYITLLADLMTVDGQIKAIGRYGISGQKLSVLVRASFEETKKHFVGASVRGEKDNLRGAIENIMLNQVAPVGTGSFELIGHIPELKKESKSKKKK
ncbi:MAG: DNA-directed RNA polymerase subunit A'' [Candidatus Aenigmatarchaeota archaeon]|nr:MAG: DNA-directed RNA polymerase subunit A'' [Candidatus Aenigmarchaeota archaeon]